MVINGILLFGHGCLKPVIVKYSLSWHGVCFVAWTVLATFVLATFQADYVPLLGRKRLPECVKYGSELTQCGMVTATWIFATLFR